MSSVDERARRTINALENRVSELARRVRDTETRLDRLEASEGPKKGL